MLELKLEILPHCLLLHCWICLILSCKRFSHYTHFFIRYSIWKFLLDIIIIIFLLAPFQSFRKILIDLECLCFIWCHIQYYLVKFLDINVFFHEALSFYSSLKSLTHIKFFFFFLMWCKVWSKVYVCILLPFLVYFVFFCRSKFLFTILLILSEDFI